MTTPTSGQFEGLADRDRVFPQDFTRQKLGRIEVDSIKIGGVEISAIGGTRYANGRILIAGLKDNSAELELHPGPECSGRGVMTQILLFTWRKATGWMRHCFSWNFDGTNDLFVEDQGVSGDREQAPWFRITGQKTYEAPGDDPVTGKHYEYGEDNGGRYIDAYFFNGSDEYYLSDGRRVGLQSLIGAMVKIAEKNGVAFDIR